MQWQRKGTHEHSANTKKHFCTAICIGLHFVIAFNIMPQRQESSNCVDATYQICDAGDLVIMQHTSEV
jgi:hypothetical protein